MRHLIAGLRRDAGDYAKAAQGIKTSHDLEWDANNVRAWDAANLIESMLVRKAYGSGS